MSLKRIADLDDGIFLGRRDAAIRPGALGSRARRFFYILVGYVKKQSVIALLKAQPTHMSPLVAIVTNPNHLLSVSPVIVQKKIHHLGMFAKFWEPGKVKTRLASDIGPERASEIYLAFCQTLLARLSNAADERSIVYAPAERKNEFLTVAQDTWQIVPQTKGDLGRRMSEFFHAKLAEPQTKVVVIGSDCLDIDVALIDQAFAALNEVDVVLGPSEDGGYYLIGMSTFRPEVFVDIAWSTESVMSQTLERIANNDISHTLLPSLNDIDDLGDLEQLLSNLQANSSTKEQRIHCDPTEQSLQHAIEKALPQS